MLKKAQDKTVLMLEILYELINAGQDFQTADEILEQSAEIMLKELKADLYVCRLRDAEGNWVNIAANTHTGHATPIFVKIMEENLPRHPVMRSINDPHILFVLSNNLMGPETGRRIHRLRAVSGRLPVPVVVSVARGRGQGLRARDALFQEGAVFRPGTNPTF